VSLLKQKIIEKIISQGPISFEIFMDMCLYYPGLGYYAKDPMNIGRSGDFYTSPHLHRIFGAMLGRQIEEMRSFMESEEFRIVEMGAGMGWLAKDVMEYLKDRDIFKHLGYTIIEMNPSMQARQKKLLEEFGDKVGWAFSLEDIRPFTGFFISNELLDAFPVRLIEMRDGLKEIYVSVEGDELIESAMQCGDEAKSYLNEFNIELPERYRTEVNLRIKDWLGALNDKLSQGFILTIDYGYPASDYYGDERNRGTLLCYHRHRLNENPYQNIGEQDITAHVNFSSLKKWGDMFGLKTIGFCSQGTYLVSLGIDEAVKELYGDSPDQFETAKIKGLILPQGMGESHKAMIQYKGAGEPALKGFALRNQVKYL
jgi:SAM-dependent MidA family methyltransferase